MVGYPADEIVLAGGVQVDRRLAAVVAANGAAARAGVVGSGVHLIDVVLRGGVFEDCSGQNVDSIRSWKLLTN